MNWIAKKIEVVDVHKLNSYANNARVHSDHQVEVLASAIQQFGFTNPILANIDGTIVAGHGRLMAAQRLKMKQVPVIYVDHLSERQRQALVLADNKIQQLGTWDFDKLADELSQLADQEFDLGLTGFNEHEIDALLRDDQNILPTSITGGNTIDVSAHKRTIDGNHEQDAEPLTNQESITAYSKKIKSPVYEPRNEKPSAATVFDADKTIALLDEIDAADIPEDDKMLLRFAAQRHTVFNYEMIADYYAHSQAAVQRLMEKSALVIIDFNKAIENGFIQLSQEIIEQYKEDNEDY
jgi:ParB-like chromosome segregation protein Spo0J